MTTPFWQIRQKNFLIKRDNFLNDEAIVEDFKRGMHRISLNDKALSIIFAEKLGLSSHNKSNSQIEKLILDEMAKETCKYTYPDLIKEILQEQFFPNKNENSTKYVGTLFKACNQSGLLYPGAQSLKGQINVPYLIGTDGVESRVNISLKKGKILIDEWSDITTIQKIRNEDETKTAQANKDYNPTYSLKNDDNTPLVTIKNRFTIKVDEGHLKYSHTDLTLQYNNKEIQQAYDKRGGVTKLIDFIKSIFKANGITEFKAQKPIIEIVDADEHNEQDNQSFNSPSF